MQIERKRKVIATFFLLVLSVELFVPAVSFALTNGPAQPEMQKFEAAGATEMVDLFSGDMKYNIPLLDVGGYPVNISYNSGTGMEDEASWVGAGWTLNPGAVNRTMRGLPDDFNGDLVTKEYSRKPFEKIGGQVVLKPSLFAWETGGINASVKLNVYKDNYYGIGASFGAGLDFNLAKESKTSLTAGLGLDVNSDVRNGVDVSPSMSLGIDHDFKKENFGLSLSGGFDYNSRSGLKNISLGATFSTMPSSSLTRDIKRNSFSSSAVNYFGQSYTPAIKNNTTNSSFTLNFDFGPTVFGGYIGLGGAGYGYKEKISEPVALAPAFGYMHYLKGRRNEDALLDFNREKDGVFLTSNPAIATPVATNDFFVASGQTGSQQFRAHLGTGFVSFDKKYSNVNTANTDIGVTIGVINAFKGGGRVNYSSGRSATKKWTSNNIFLEHAEPAFSNSPAEEGVYFKQVGEKTISDNNFYNTFLNTTLSQVKLNRASSSKNLTTRNGTEATSLIKKTNKEKRVYGFQYLTQAQAKKYALDKKINGVERDDASHDYRRSHHMSEVTVTDNEGKRMVYGIPVYNRKQEEVTFSIKEPTNKEEARRTGLVSYSAADASFANRNGRDWMYSREKIPAYATSFLLTGILSPDYVDVKADGITDDDLGTAVKFKYKEITSRNNLYKWRAPYQQDMANYNEGFLSDPKDDKASYVYGEKEIWYLDAIESKTMVAVFLRSGRRDAYGVAGENGGRGGIQLEKLDTIKLYSKADLIKNGVNAIPVKTVVFEYDYSLFPGIPNNAVNTGKLTLKKIYFTFGKNQRGKLNPYEFSYDETLVNAANIIGLPAIPLTNAENSDDYLERQSDRWGVYKKSYYNRLVNGNPVLNNSEFPYVPQVSESNPYVRALADKLASKWQLKKIITPSSGIIEVEYEADDYAYVQNRRAMQMCFVKEVVATDDKGLISASQIKVELPKSITTTNATEAKKEFIRLYMTEADGKPMGKMFYKFLCDVDNKNHYEYVHGYAEIDWTNTTAIGNTATIGLKKVDGYNPIAKAAWQMLRTDLPQFAYDNYDNSGANGFSGDFAAAIKSMVSAIVGVGELFRSFDKRAENRKFAKNVDLNASMVRLFQPDLKKIGGGSRVKKIQISDDWEAMSNTDGAKTSKYGQTYTYTTTDNQGKTISSGVASYEPQIGNEENPFHEPISFTETVHWSKDRYHFIEKPFCETFFPSASVGYSKVKVTSFGNDFTGSGEVPSEKQHTGYIIHEFFTAKDFPTKVDYLPLEQKAYENSLIMKLFSTRSVKKLSASQGFKIELNDMHGKPQSVKVFDKAGSMLSSTEYHYNIVDEDAAEKELRNEVPVLNADGTYSTQTIATDIDFVTDVRESLSTTTGGSRGAYVGSALFGLIPGTYAGMAYSQNSSFDLFNSIACVKVINRFGIVSKVVTTQNGSTIVAENLLWDGETGEVLVTKTQNEFDQYTYAFNYPAHMVAEYEGMGSAYKNLGITFTNFVTGTDGKIALTSLSAADQQKYLFPGDELVYISGLGELKGWIIKSIDGSYRLIDKNGNFIQATGSWLLLRSGRRNLLTAGVGSVISMKNPMQNGRIELDVDEKILDSKAVLYKDEWGIPVSNMNTEEQPLASGKWGLKWEYWLAFSRSLFEINNATGKRYLFSFVNDQVTVGDIIRVGIQKGYFASGSNPLLDFFNPCIGGTIPSVDNIYYYLGTKRELSPAGSGYMILGDDKGFFATSQQQKISEISFVGFNAGVMNFLNNGSGQPKRDLFGFGIGSCTTSASYKIANCNVEEGTTQEEGSANTSEGIDSIIYPEPEPPVSVYTTTCRFKLNISGLLLSDAPIVESCVSPIDRVFNPYYKGVLGNWRPLMNYVYTVNREQKPGNPAQTGGTDIRNSGAYVSYAPFWQWPTGSRLERSFTDAVNLPLSDARSRWIWSSKSIHFDQKGNEVENVDALNRFGSALFGYRESVAIAVGANARRNEIAFDGFEDYDFELENNLNQYVCPPKRHLDFGFTKQGINWVSSAGSIVSNLSHTGKHSYAISSSVNLIKNAGLAAPSTAALLGFDNIGRYLLKSNELANGFAPVAGKKYLFSMWVKDNSPNENTIQGLTIKFNNITKDISALTVPVVEGWKRLELSFTASSQFQLELIPSGTIYLDDIRILPNDAQMNSYVFDNRTLRLMAQLDENNFATIYEYDEEGTPVRVKKETERGIMTIKESRQSLRKRN
ncbi:hypothetical protein [Lacibacter sp.]|uniref:hypothetical protein n=1 Tax=Lacibacter sp. TaxID=1915409 RepID=UPI002B4B77B7|nr:hypothetical protein [Lacibacter sp.]HLP39532.1 hypothetical protein [Lacibacter sp.]